MKYLDTRGNATLGIGICDRCSKKFPLGELHKDPNSPGLAVCPEDLDEYDPYKLAPRTPDMVNLPFTSPDASLATSPSGLITEDGTNFIVSEDGERFIFLID